MPTDFDFVQEMKELGMPEPVAQRLRTMILEGTLDFRHFNYERFPKKLHGRLNEILGKMTTIAIFGE